MVFSPVAWAYKDVITSAKLAQMVENIVKHDHRGDGTQGDGVAYATLPLTAPWGGAIYYGRRGGNVSVIALPANAAAWAAGVVIATLPVGFRPAAPTAFAGYQPGNGAVNFLRADPDGTIRAVNAGAAGVGGITASGSFHPA